MPGLDQRTAHLVWAKQRALAYLPYDPTLAFKSIMSDLLQEPTTADHGGIKLGTLLYAMGLLDTAEQVKDFIDGLS